MQQNDKVSNEIKISSKRLKQDFALTQQQRIYIQYHLPKFFTLVPVTNTNSRLNCTSQILVEESLTFIERKRGRPEGSGRKTQKTAFQRKSKRLAKTSKSKQSVLKDHQKGLLDYSNSSNREKQSNKNQQNCSLSSLKYIEDPCLMESKSQQQMAKTCKQSQFGEQYEKGLLEKALGQQIPIIVNTQQIPPTEVIAEKDCSKKEESKQVNQPKQPLKSQPVPQKVQINEKQQKYPFQQQKVIIRKLKSHRQILPFLQPVDEIRDGAPNYYKQIASPIDLQTIQFKLKTGIYKMSQQFHTDVRLMWANAKSYNRKNNHMQEVTQTLENYYLNILSKSKSQGTTPKKKSTKK